MLRGAGDQLAREMFEAERRQLEKPTGTAIDSGDDNEVEIYPRQVHFLILLMSAFFVFSFRISTYFSFQIVLRVLRHKVHKFSWHESPLLHILRCNFFKLIFLLWGLSLIFVVQYCASLCSVGTGSRAEDFCDTSFKHLCTTSISSQHLSVIPSFSHFPSLFFVPHIFRLSLHLHGFLIYVFLHFTSVYIHPCLIRILALIIYKIFPHPFTTSTTKCFLLLIPHFLPSISR